MDYWASLIAHWVKKELDELGYTEPDDMSVMRLTEMTTRDVAFFHYRESDKVCNIIIPRGGTLYNFITDKNFRVANCVFRVTPPIDGYSVEFMKVNNYGKATKTNDYIVFENVAITAVDNLESCSLVSQNQEDLDHYKFPFPVDIFHRVMKLFGL